MHALLADVLEAWRGAERLAAEHETACPHHSEALAMAERLREVYHELAGSSAARGEPLTGARVLGAEAQAIES